MARHLSPLRPLSVVVLGNSVSVLSLPQREGPSDGTYAEVLRDRLVAEGVPTRVHQEGRWFDFAVKGLRRYESSVRTHLPDVLVLQYGVNESQPWLLPVPVLRHFLTSHRTTTRTGRWYRDTVAPPIWRGLRSYRRWASPMVGSRTWQTTPHRFGEAIRQLIRAVRHDFQPLVLVLDVQLPPEALEHFLPGMAPRHERIQQVLRDVVAEFGSSDVRLVEVSKLIEAAGPEAMTDVTHYTPLGHRVVGDALAREVLEWLG